MVTHWTAGAVAWCGLLLIMALWIKAEPWGICVRATPHKAEPGPEEKLYGECAPWAGKACCSASTAFSAHLDNSPLYNFSFSHCGLLEPACKQHFSQAACFYECSPNLGPWIQKIAGGRERVQAVPLCVEDCKQWWLDCSSAFTCKTNWHSGGWQWRQGANRCPEGAPCWPFPLVFPSPAHLCAGVWDGAFRASPEPRASGLCLQKWFEPGMDNPNEKVSQRLADLATYPLPTVLLSLLSLLCLLLLSPSHTPYFPGMKAGVAAGLPCAPPAMHR